MIAKGATTVKKLNVIPCGCHLVVVSDIKYARDYKGETLADAMTGELTAIDVIFKDSTKRELTSRFWLSDKARWVLDNFCAALGVSTKKQSVQKDQVVGKQLYIVIAATFCTNTGQRSKQVDVKLVPKFFTASGPVPKISGDPLHNNGVPSGVFAIETAVDRPTFLRYNGATS